jgi:hypothetical protein
MEAQSDSRPEESDPWGFLCQRLRNLASPTRPLAPTTADMIPPAQIKFVSDLAQLVEALIYVGELQTVAKLDSLIPF